MHYEPYTLDEPPLACAPNAPCAPYQPHAPCELHEPLAPYESHEPHAPCVLHKPCEPHKPCQPDVIILIINNNNFEYNTNGYKLNYNIAKKFRQNLRRHACCFDCKMGFRLSFYNNNGAILPRFDYGAAVKLEITYTGEIT